MSIPRDMLIEALDLALAGDWNAAHDIVNDVTDDRTACWIHAVLHKMEPDETNARYWYRKAGQFYESFAEPTSELAAIRASLTY